MIAHTILMAIFQVNSGVSHLPPWLSVFNHPYTEHRHKTGRNAAVHIHMVPWAEAARIDHHPKGFWSSSFYGPDALSVAQPTVSKPWRQYGNNNNNNNNNKVM